MGRLRNYAADTTVMVAASFGLGYILEMGIAGMDSDEYLKSRLLNLPLNLVASRPYGIYRDHIIKKFGGGKVRNYMADVGAFITFQSPLYAGVLATVGADADEIGKAVLTITALAPVFGKIIGSTMDLSRKYVFRIPEEDNNDTH